MRRRGTPKREAAGYPGHLQTLGRGAWGLGPRREGCEPLDPGALSVSLMPGCLSHPLSAHPIPSCGSESVPEVLCEMGNWVLGRFRVFRKQELLIETSSVRGPGPCP